MMGGQIFMQTPKPVAAAAGNLNCKTRRGATMRHFVVHIKRLGCQCQSRYVNSYGLRSRLLFDVWLLFLRLFRPDNDGAGIARVFLRRALRIGFKLAADGKPACSNWRKNFKFKSVSNASHAFRHSNVYRERMQATRSVGYVLHRGKNTPVMSDYVCRGYAQETETTVKHGKRNL